MKCRVLGAFTLAGTGDNGPYDFGKVLIEVPMENVSGKAFKKTGFGNEASEMVLDSKCIEQFAHVTLPGDVTLKTEPQSVKGEWITVCIGVEPGVAKAAVRSA